MKIPRSRVNKTKLFLLLLLISMAIVNILLLQQNLQMRAALNKNQPEMPQVGEKLQSLFGKDMNGGDVKINFSENSKKRFFLYFSPACQYCKHQFPDWKDLVLHTNSEQIEVWGVVSRDEKQKNIEEYLRMFELDSTSNIPLQIIFVSDEQLQNYKLKLTPTTILVSGEGSVEKSWIGKWNVSDKKDAFARLK